MVLSNDERGWIMTCLSAIACVFGASIICVDVLIQKIPGKQHFHIQNSDSFLSVSLSLSFGVMLFSSLYSMLPSSKKSLQNGGFSPKEASWIMVACFMAGVIGIQIVSNVLHRFMPSQVVDCEHTHDTEDRTKENGHVHTHDHEHTHRGHDDSAPTSTARSPTLSRTEDNQTLLNNSRSGPLRLASYPERMPNSSLAQRLESDGDRQQSMMQLEGFPRTTSLQTLITTGVSQLTSGNNPVCEVHGSCYGYSDLCGQDCFKTMTARGGSRGGLNTAGSRPRIAKRATVNETTPLLHDIAEESLSRPHTQAVAEGAAAAAQDQQTEFLALAPPVAASRMGLTSPDSTADLLKSSTHESDSVEDSDNRHHHHVPTNAFLSIGLQTSIAIALHKLPEGFITFATNHANPKLGVSVFLALFIHNITEGFALALPLYLAMNNRVKAMAISFVLGGLSQPLGAGVAALWFKLAGRSQWAPSDGMYGGMFAVIAGIMASVALQLFSESLDLTHSKNLCMTGAFAGMMILAMSSALTA